MAGHRRSRCVATASPARHASSPGSGTRVRAHARMTTSSHAHPERCACRWLAGYRKSSKSTAGGGGCFPDTISTDPNIYGMLKASILPSITPTHPNLSYPPQPLATATEEPAPSPRPARCAPSLGAPCMLVGAVVSFATRTAGMLLAASCSVRVVASERVRRACSVCGSCRRPRKALCMHSVVAHM